MSDDFLKSLKVLYVEDEDGVRDMLSRFLSRKFAVVEAAENGKIGLDKFLGGEFDVVITDIRMPVMDGLEMIEQIKRLKEDTPVIVVTAFSDSDYLMRAIDVGVNSYVKKPIDMNRLVDAIHKATRARFHEKETQIAKQKTLDILMQTVEAMARAIEKRDPYTDGHQKKVSALGAMIASELGLPEESITAIRLGGLIHDIGKLSVPSEILSMPRKLDDVEFAIVKKHPKAGFDILGDISFPWPIAQIVLEHHEHADGSGYPNGLIKENIAIEARIICVADVVEAISSHRPYRPALGMAAAIEELKANRGILYDEMVVDACLKIIEEKGDSLWESVK